MKYPSDLNLVPRKIKKRKFKPSSVAAVIISVVILGGGVFSGIWFPSKMLEERRLKYDDIHKKLLESKAAFAASEAKLNRLNAIETTLASLNRFVDPQSAYDTLNIILTEAQNKVAYSSFDFSPSGVVFIGAARNDSIITDFAARLRENAMFSSVHVDSVEENGVFSKMYVDLDEAADGFEDIRYYSISIIYASGSAAAAGGEAK